MDLDVRVGDAERRAVDARLVAACGDGVLTLGEYEERAAAVWAARTRRDLDAVVRDLPPVGGPAPTGPTEPRRAVAVLSGDELKAPFYVGQPVEAYAVLGEVKVDLRTADLPAETRLRAMALLGSVEVLVPRGTTVHLGGAAVLGGRELALDPPRPGGPVLHLDAWAVLGAVEVGHGKGRAADVVVGGPAHAAPPVPHRVTPARPAAWRRVGRRVAGVLATVALVGGLVLAASAATDELVVLGSGTQVVTAEGTVDVGVVMGSVTVVVPDDAQVGTGGFRLMASLDCAACLVTTGDGPEIEVRGWGLMGSVEVLTRSQIQDRQGSGR